MFHALEPDQLVALEGTTAVPTLMGTYTSACQRCFATAYCTRRRLTYGVHRAREGEAAFVACDGACGPRSFTNAAILGDGSAVFVDPWSVVKVADPNSWVSMVKMPIVVGERRRATPSEDEEACVTCTDRC